MPIVLQCLFGRKKGAVESLEAALGDANAVFCSAAKTGSTFSC